MWWRCWKELGEQQGYRPRFGSTKAPSLCRAILIYGLITAASLDFSCQGKPTDNAFIDAFNGRFRAEGLNAHWFLSFADAEIEVEVLR